MEIIISFSSEQFWLHGCRHRQSHSNVVSPYISSVYRKFYVMYSQLRADSEIIESEPHLWSHARTTYRRRLQQTHVQLCMRSRVVALCFPINSNKVLSLINYNFFSLHRRKCGVYGCDHTNEWASTPNHITTDMTHAINMIKTLFSSYIHIYILKYLLISLYIWYIYVYYRLRRCKFRGWFDVSLALFLANKIWPKFI